MKKLFLVTFIVLYYLSLGFAQGNDSVFKQRFSMKIDPFLIFPTGEYGFMFEHQFTTKMSYEIGGGVMLKPNIYANEDAYEYGYTLRLNYRYYLSKKKYNTFYFSPQFFYRYMKFTERLYQQKTGKIKETYSGLFDTDTGIREMGNEDKHVFSFQFIWGNKSDKWGTNHKIPAISKHLFWGWYAGPGIRLKHRMREINYKCSCNDVSYVLSFKLNEPETDIIDDWLLTVQAGFTFGVSF